MKNCLTISKVKIMKKFNLCEFKKNPSRKVVTRDGKPVRILCTNAKGDYPIVGLIYYHDEREIPENYTENGSCYIDNDESSSDLFFESLMKYGWMNIFKHGNDIQNSCIYDTEEEAETHTARGKNSHYIATIKVEWEEEE